MRRATPSPTWRRAWSFDATQTARLVLTLDDLSASLEDNGLPVTKQQQFPVGGVRL